MWFRLGNPFIYAVTNANMVKGSNVLPSGLLFACTFPSIFFVHSQNLPTFIKFFLLTWLYVNIGMTSSMWIRLFNG